MKTVLKVIGWILTLYAIVGGGASILIGNVPFLMAIFLMVVCLLLARLCFRKAESMGAKSTVAADDQPPKKKRSQMKIAVIVSIVVLIFGQIARQVRNSGSNRISSQVEQINSICPIPTAGGAATLTGAELDNGLLVLKMKFKPGTVDVKAFSDSPDAARDLLLISFIQSGNSGRKLFDQITGEGLGIRLDIDDSNGGTFSSVMSQEYIKEKLAEIEEDAPTALRDAMQLRVDIDSKQLPTPMTQGMDITAYQIKDSNIVAVITVDEGMYSISALRANALAIKNDMVKTMGSDDPAVKALTSICQVAHFGFILRFTGSVSGRRVDVGISYADMQMAPLTSAFESIDSI